MSVKIKYTFIEIFEEKGGVVHINTMLYKGSVKVYFKVGI